LLGGGGLVDGICEEDHALRLRLLPGSERQKPHVRLMVGHHLLQEDVGSGRHQRDDRERDPVRALDDHDQPAGRASGFLLRHDPSPCNPLAGD